MYSYFPLNILFHSKNCLFAHKTAVGKKDEKEGRGKFTYKSGDSYEGEWERNKKHGKGVIIHSNGNKEEVEFYNNRKVEKN